MSTEVTIRLAQREEQKALEDLQRNASLVWEEYREMLFAHPDAIELPLEQIKAGRVFVAERRGKILGFSVVLTRSDGNAELDGLFVDPGIWNQGIGRLVVQDAARFAASEGAIFLCVVANPKAPGFYSACKFEFVGEVHTRFGVGHTMRMRLKSLMGTNA